MDAWLLSARGGAFYKLKVEGALEQRVIYESIHRVKSAWITMNTGHTVSSDLWRTNGMCKGRREARQHQRCVWMLLHWKVVSEGMFGGGKGV